MPIYFFDTDDGKTLYRDDIGTDVVSDEAASDEATHAMAELAKDHIPDGAPPRNITMWVRRANGEPLMVLTLNFAIVPMRP